MSIHHLTDASVFCCDQQVDSNCREHSTFPPESSSFGQQVHVHIWSYIAVWMLDNEAGPFRHSWQFDTELDVHCQDSMVRPCHYGTQKVIMWNKMLFTLSLPDCTLSGTNTFGTLGHFGLNFPRNGKHYVCEWLQSTTVKDKLQSANPTAPVLSDLVAVMADEHW